MGDNIKINEKNPLNLQDRTDIPDPDTGFGTPDVLLSSFDRTGKIMSVNPYGLGLLGSTEGEILGRDWFATFLSPALAETERARVLPPSGGSGPSPGPGTLESQLVTKGGASRTIVWNFVPVRDGTGAVTGTVAAGTDVTDWKRTFDTLQENEHYLRSIFNFVQTGLVLLDPETHMITDVNPMAVELIGIERDKIIGSICHQFICPAQKGKCPITDLHQTVDRSERVMLTAKGVRTPIIKSVIPITIRGRSYLLESIFDITELKRAQEEVRKKTVELSELRKAEAEILKKTEELARSNLELQQFAYIASHDLQEPLRAISGFTELLAKRYRGKLDERADKYIGFITEGATRMQQMIQDLLTYSRVETQAHAFEKTDSNVSLDQAITNLKILIEENHAVITHDRLPQISADREQITLLFQNLIGNAIKFHKTGVIPEIHVSAQSDAGKWVFSVSDNGIGVDQKYADRLFKIFSRLHTRDEYPGTGIGLAICKRIMERHSGNIWLKSSPGAGSTFYFAIPEEKQGEQTKAEGEQP
jgi:PAS domain S-box-containing protein